MLPKNKSKYAVAAINASEEFYKTSVNHYSQNTKSVPLPLP